MFDDTGTGLADCRISVRRAWAGLRARDGEVLLPLHGSLCCRLKLDQIFAEDKTVAIEPVYLQKWWHRMEKKNFRGAKNGS